MTNYNRFTKKEDEWWRPVVSRGTMLVLALLLLWGGFKCFKTASYLREDYAQRVERGETPARTGRRRASASGAGLPTLAGVVLVVLGGGLGVLAVLPMNLMEKINPSASTLDDD